MPTKSWDPRDFFHWFLLTCAPLQSRFLFFFGFRVQALSYTFVLDRLCIRTNHCFLRKIHQVLQQNSQSTFLVGS
ncbi:hypothetical protein PCASD_16411 [Puccinia coronata f. sp. avenae]|uniref:Uncharacterized protein n=1 Tax=Puccinia coronata f. sp. avenae TaxID=200324 RepID=A0A2N5TCQ0_9BASI|nr:hypothetical protein PCASD_16411 [Puccinia coronata f. sp. avenae]